ncbi:MAG: Crp/Fnr family transcriptional regulator [Clostridiales bacterium]|nr:Crp/Fnr family transcriptional regulator [Clostridiales bacterium]
MQESNYDNMESVLLASTFLFAEAGPLAVDALLNSPLSERKVFPAGGYIRGRETHANSLGILLSGKAKVIKSGVILRLLRTGDLFGAGTLFGSDKNALSDIVAVKPCRVLFLPRELLLELMRENFAVAQSYMRFLSGRVCFLNRLIDEYTGHTVKARLATFLLNAAVGRGGNDLTLDYNMRELAAALNVGRASLYRSLALLIKDGLISRQDKHIKILDIEGLKNIRK